MQESIFGCVRQETQCIYISVGNGKNFKKKKEMEKTDIFSGLSNNSEIKSDNEICTITRNKHIIYLWNYSQCIHDLKGRAGKNIYPKIIFFNNMKVSVHQEK